MVKKKVVTISMKPTHLMPSSAPKTRPITKPVTKPKTTTSKTTRQVQKTQQRASNAVQRFDIRLLSYHPIQDDAGVIIRLFYDGNFFQQVVLLKSIYEVWSRANIDQRRQFIANQLNTQFFGNKANIVWNVCNSIVGIIDPIVNMYIAQELAKQAQARRRM